jgi:SAM-dependent methyltransferase
MSAKRPPEAFSAADEGLAERHWDALHALPRFRPRFPSEHVVRFLLARFPEQERARLRALDVGSGGGRHTKLLADLRFEATGLDLSREGLVHTKRFLRASGQHARLCQASMLALPFADGAFDAVVSFAAYYYVDRAGMRRAISELRRVLHPGGWGFVVLRTDRDYRYGKGLEIEPHTFRLTISDTNEAGCVMHFVTEENVPAMFEGFSDLEFERTETTFGGRTESNSDWLIQVRK